jgi:hypothetical protein
MIAAEKIDVAEPPTKRAVFAKTPIHRCGGSSAAS